MMINVIKREVQEAMKCMRGFELIMITEGSPEETLNCGKSGGQSILGRESNRLEKRERTRENRGKKHRSSYL